MAVAVLAPVMARVTPRHKKVGDMAAGKLSWSIGVASIAVSATAIVAAVAISWAVDSRAEIVVWAPERMLWVIVWLPPVGFGLGLTSLVAQIIAERRGRRVGRRSAGPGLLLAVGAAFFVCFIMGVTIHDYEGLKKSTTLAHLRVLCIAALEYADDHGGRLPARDGWCDELMAYVHNPRVFRSPLAPRLRCAFVFNSALSKLRPDDFGNAQKLVMIFGSDRGRNASGGQELFALMPGDEEGNAVGFADSHTNFVRMPASHIARGTALEWQPRLAHSR